MTAAAARLGDDIAAEWHASLLARPTEVERAVDEAIERAARAGVQLPYRGFRLPLTPAVLPAAWCSRLEAGCRAIFEGIGLLVDRAFGGDPDRLADFLLLAAGERALLDLNAGRYDWAAVARPDFMVGPRGPMVIETNLTTSIGLVECGELARVLGRIPGFDRLLTERAMATTDPAEALADSIAAAARGQPDPLVVIADWAEDFRIWGFIGHELAALLAERGVPAVAARLEDVEPRAGGAALDGRRISLLYRFFTTTVFRDEEVCRRYEWLFDAVRSGAVGVYGGFGHKLYTPKLFLALLSDEEYAHLLPPSLRAALADVLPWTRLLAPRHTDFRGERVDLLEAARRHRDELVLKPNLGYGGRDVSIGSALDQAEWERRLEAALASGEHWLLQERLETERRELAFSVDGEIVLQEAKVDYGVFMIGRRYAGAARRNATAATGPDLTNLSRGGGLSPVFTLP
ncbi:MAG: hypothetical protein ACJ73E_18125 [Mycobacteriales bacterium]